MEQADLLRKVIDVLENLGGAYMIVGSIASGAYGEPRLTQDIDVVAELEYGDVDRLCEFFGSEEYYFSPEAARQAIRTAGQFNIIHPASGNKIDVMLPRQDAWGQCQLARRNRVVILPDMEGYTARPEDVILAKMQYYREGGSEKHLRDITGILKVSGEDVDRAYVNKWAEQLNLKEIWDAILRRLERDEE